MSVENQTESVETENQETTQTVEVQAPAFDPFAENQPDIQHSSNAKTEVEASNVTEVAENVSRETNEETEEEIVDANEYLKQNLGFDDWDAAKAALSELNDLKEKAKTPAEIKFANEQSKAIYNALTSDDPQAMDKVYEFMDTQKKLAAVDKMDAATAIKLKIQSDNKHFKPEDVADVFEEKYEIPEKPEQKVDELDDEFEARMNKYNAKVEKVTRRIERDAVTAKAELSKLRSELVLPDIFKEKEAAKAPEPTPEELAKNKAFAESYLKSVDASVKNFNGFNVVVKDKEVEIPISYTPTEEQKAKIANDMKFLADHNYDMNILFAPRWVKEDGSLNTDQIAKDYFRLLYGEQAEQKFATEAASKRVVEKAKKDSNIQIRSNSTPSKTFTATDGAAAQNALAEFFFANT